MNDDQYWAIFFFFFFYFFEILLTILHGGNPGMLFLKTTLALTKLNIYIY